MEKELVLDEQFGKYKGKKVVELIPENVIKKRVKELAKEISNDYKEEVPIFISVLNGSFIFLADLFRELDIYGEVDFIKISSYIDETKSSGTVRLIKDISCSVTGRDVIVVEDIIDTGLSMSFLMNRLKESDANSVRVATLLLKETAKLDFEVDYVGFKISDKYVVGYGLDLAQKLRNLKSIYALN